MAEDKSDSLNLTPDPDLGPTPSPTTELQEQEVLPPGRETSDKAAITFMGNSYDLAAVVGATVGGIVLLTCATCNLGYYCLPVVAILLGVIGLVTAKDSVDPDRTRLLSWIGLGSGAAIIALIMLAVIIYVGIMVFAIVTEGNGGF